jgi:hypothetical protein
MMIRICADKNRKNLLMPRNSEDFDRVYKTKKNGSVIPTEPFSADSIESLVSPKGV